MKLRSFFTRQRYIILGTGIVLFAGCLSLALHFGHETEAGLLFIDLSGAAITIMATALVIEFFQYAEQADKTHQVAAIAEGEIQALCYRTKLMIVSLYGFEQDLARRNTLASLATTQAYLSDTSEDIETFYDNMPTKLPSFTVTRLERYIQSCASLQAEAVTIIELYDYALPYSLRTRVLALRAKLQVTERAVRYIDTTRGLKKNHHALIAETATTIFETAQTVLAHGSRTETDTPLQSKSGRVTRS